MSTGGGDRAGVDEKGVEVRARRRPCEHTS